MTTMPLAEVLEVLDEWVEANNVNRRRGHEKVRMDAELEQARTAVAALIEREAALQVRLRSLCQMLVAAVGADGPCNAEDVAARLISERDALAARVAELEAELKEYRDAVSACEGGNLCRCSIEFPARAESGHV